MRRRILINFLYYNAVGHVAEALKYARGYFEANEDVEVSLALNKYSPTELAARLPWLKAVYPIDILEVREKGAQARTLRQLPREWDYILIDDRPMKEVPQVREGTWPQLPKNRKRNLEGLLASYEACGTLLKAADGTYPVWTPPRGLKYTKGAKLVLDVPPEAESFVRKRYTFSGIKIGIMLGGSKGAVAYPSIRSWTKIIRALNTEFPAARIYLTGVHEKRAGRSVTRAFTRDQLAYLFRRFDNLTDCYDIGLWNQIALLRHLDVLISPHTGFAFLALCVDTPWLTISGGNWAEYFFNQTPFYSVLPDDPNFPYRNRFPELHYRFKRSGKILPMQPARLEKKIPEIVRAVSLLLDEGFTYRRALNAYRQNVARADVDRAQIPLGPMF